jgi:hypothetical protein
MHICAARLESELGILLQQAHITLKFTLQYTPATGSHWCSFTHCRNADQDKSDNAAHAHRQCNIISSKNISSKNISSKNLSIVPSD